jgi:hypothetical protein
LGTQSKSHSKRTGVQGVREGLVHLVEVETVFDQVGEGKSTMVMFDEFHCGEEVLVVVAVEAAKGEEVADQVLGVQRQWSLRQRVV